MKLQEFFDTQKHISFTDVDKLDLYQNILYKKTKRPSLKRSIFVHAKNMVYTMVLAVLILGVYGVYFINNNNLQDYNWFAIKSNTTNTAQADYIAQVINTKGNFFIEHDGVLTQTNNIGNGDTILLKQGAELVFEINSGTQSKIIGPAKLIIQKTNTDDYKLNLIYGDFMQMEGNAQKTQSIELAINDITIKQQDRSKPLNFKFIKNGNNKIVQNNGANIIITKSNGTDQTTTISKQQVMTIQNNDIKVFANISTFTKAIQEKNISQTFTLADQTITSSGEVSGKDETSLVLTLLNTQQITENKDEITKNISSVLSDQKEILDPSQDEKISSSLYSEFYTSELKDIEAAFIAGNEQVFTTAYNKIEKRIQTVYQGFGIEYTRQSGDPKQKLEGLQSAITNLQNKITIQYNVPPKYSDSLQSIQKLLKNIISQGYASQKSHESATGEIIETK